jgi:N-methylhydantoinase B
MGQRGATAWSVNAQIDRTRFAAPGLAGGKAGAPGALAIDGVASAQPKARTLLDPASRVQLSPPGGGGYGDPFSRAPELVLADVVSGYVSIEGAARDYGVAVRYLGEPERLVRLPEHYAIDAEATARLRGSL